MCKSFPYQGWSIPINSIDSSASPTEFFQLKNKEKKYIFAQCSQYLGNRLASPKARFQRNQARVEYIFYFFWQQLMKSQSRQNP